MARPVRKKLKFDEESVNKLLQEIYDDSHNIRAKITRLFTKWEQKVKEGGEIQAIGDQIVKLISAEAKNQDQKIMLLKYLKEVVFKDKNSEGSGNDNEEQKEISTERRNELLNMVRNEIESKNKK
jgi:membrane-bound lytic murein transglycosylase